jgi:uncharacterized protein YegJ (DUF2314 family)
MSIYKLGDHVKVEFADQESGEFEWMWVKADHSDNENRFIFGKLDSQPVVITNLRVGQGLAISYDRIRDHQRFEQL